MLGEPPIPPPPLPAASAVPVNPATGQARRPAAVIAMSLRMRASRTAFRQLCHRSAARSRAEAASSRALVALSPYLGSIPDPSRVGLDALQEGVSQCSSA